MRRTLSAVLSLLVLAGVPAVAVADGDSVCQQQTPSRDGTGKVYMGREISRVIGHLGAAWLERRDRQREERTGLLIANLPLEKDFVVADIGAGTGYFSFPVAQRVPEGQVLAVDIQEEMLDIIEARKQREGIIKGIASAISAASCFGTSGVPPKASSR